MKRLLVDFDHTLAHTVEYPYKLRVRLVNRIVHAYVRYKKRRGWTIILHTCREGRMLDWAFRFCDDCGIPVDLANVNTPEAIKEWSADPRKIAAELSIDNTQVGLLGWLLRRWG